MSINKVIIDVVTKGTEKAIRNLVRCFGIDDSLIRLNTYAHNDTYKFEAKRRESNYKGR